MYVFLRKESSTFHVNPLKNQTFHGKHLAEDSPDIKCQDLLKVSILFSEKKKNKKK